MILLRLLPWIALAIALAVAVSGFGARFGFWDFRVGFTILRVAAYAGLAVAAIALVAFVVPKTRAGRALRLALAFVIALAAAAPPLYWLHLARTVPPINDITTDTEHPPAFVAIAPLRAGSPVPAAYPGAATAEAQRAGYPDLRTIVLDRPRAAAFEAAAATARAMGWQIIATDPAGGRIEATATTSWFGFRDDIMIRVTGDSERSRVDIRSVSRVGRSDLGANARRIREFAMRLAQGS